MEEDLRKKAELILGGDVRLPKNFKIPFRLSRSTAGPGAGRPSMVFSFNGMRVKKSVSYDDGEFQLINDGGLSLHRNGGIFLDHVDIVPVVYHSPGQAFFNLDQHCMYNCLFCVSPTLGKDVTKNLTDEKIVNMVKNSNATAIALTSGVVGSVQDTVERMASCVRALRAEFPEKSIGVEPYIDSADQIDLLKDAGANEIKINRETARDDIFEKVCPELDRPHILKMLAHAVDVFGIGKVTSNIIYGFGESDDDVVNEMEMLCDIGVAPGLRPLKINSTNREKLENVLGPLVPNTPERMIRLAKMQKEIMERHGMDTRSFDTMCFECGCCDLVPFRDF